MGKGRKFWRLLVTASLAFPLNFVIACLHFLLLLAFLPESFLQLIAHPEGSRNDVESVPLELCLLTFYSAVAPLSLAFTLAARTRVQRAI